MYCLYVISFLFVKLIPESKWVSALIGSSIGGVAAGWLWTAEGTYFARSAKHYAFCSGISDAEATSLFAAIFAAIHAGCDVLMKGLTSLVHTLGGTTTFVFGFLTCMAIASSLSMFFVRAVPEFFHGGAGHTITDPLISTHSSNSHSGELRMIHPKSVWSHKLLLAVELWREETRMKLLTPMFLSFGFSSAFMNFYLNGVIVKLALGEDSIGYMSAVTPAATTLFSYPYSLLNNGFGKMPVMVLGSLNFAAASIVVLLFGEKLLISMGWWLALLYVLFGSGCAVYEGTLKAAIADFFPEDSEAAFANTIVWSGGGGALAFFVFPHMTGWGMAMVTGILSLASVCCIVAAFRVDGLVQREMSKIEL